MIGLIASLLLTQQLRPDTLSLEQALQFARVSRGAVAIAAADVARARASIRTAGTVPNPIAGYSYTEDTPRQHVSLEQSLEWLLTRGPDRAAAQASLRGARADSARARSDLTAEVRSAFYGAVAAIELERLTQDQRVLADSLARVAGVRLSRGDIPLVEQEQLSLEAVRAAQRHARAAEAAQVSRTVLLGAIGRADAGEELVLRGDLADGLSELPVSQDSSIVTPRLRVAISDSAAAEQRIRSARRARLPLPTLQVGADWDDPASKGDALAVVGFTLPLPWWQHGGGAAELAQAEADRSNAALRETRGAEARRLAETAVRLRYAAARARVARDSLLPLARRIRSRARVAYEAGESGLTLLLEALRTERDVAAEAVDDLLTWQESWTAWRQVRGNSE